MDLTGRNRWASKVKQHRSLRRRALGSNTHPTSLYEALTDYNGALLELWIAIFLNAWQRERPLDPESAAVEARAEIERFIRLEERRINREVASLFSQEELAKQKAPLDEGKKRLRESCLVLKDKCLETVDGARALRAEQLRSEREQRKDRRWDKAFTLISGALIAWLTAWATSCFTRDDVQVYKKALEELRGEVHGLRSANESTSRELTSLRGDYRQLVKWTLKSPEQIDREIARVKEDLELRKKRIREGFAEKKSDYNSDMARRGLYDSSIREGGIKQLDLDAAAELKAAGVSTTRAIEDLQEQKRRLR